MVSDYCDKYFPFRNSFLNIVQIIEELMLSDRIPTITTYYYRQDISYYGYNYSWNCGEYKIDMKITEEINKKLIIFRNISGQEYEVYGNKFYSYGYVETDGTREEIGYITKSNLYLWYTFFSDLYRLLKEKGLIDG